jgi:hypothetical protein
MQSPDIAPVSQKVDNCERTWICFLKANCDALFQIALLLSADPKVAETSVVAGIDSVDLTRPPGEEQLAALQKAVAIQAIRNTMADDSLASLRARSMLQTGLWSVLQSNTSRAPASFFDFS